MSVETQGVRRLDLPQCIVGESPRWDARRNRLVYVDIFGRSLNSYNPVSGDHQTWPVDELIGGWIPTTSGAYLLGTQSGLHLLSPETGERQLFLALEGDRPETRCNDARCDATGRLWITTMAVDGEPRPPIGAFYSVEPDGPVKKHLENMCIGNTVAFSADQKTMYLSDTPLAKVWAFDFDIVAGTISNRRDHFHLEYPGKPDGACLDAEGYLWLAVTDAGRLERRAPDGSLDRIIELPCSRPTMCAFGGSELDTLYVTSFSRHLDDQARQSQPAEGALFALNPGCVGAPEVAFACAR